MSLSARLADDWLYRQAFMRYAKGEPLHGELKRALEARRKPDGSYPVPKGLDPTVTR